MNKYILINDQNLRSTNLTFQQIDTIPRTVATNNIIVSKRRITNDLNNNQAVLRHQSQSQI